jgi:hypothetical protein
MERIFSLVKVLTSHGRCSLQLEILDKFIFFNKNWPNNPRIGCKTPSNLVWLIAIIEKRLEKFKGSFEGMNYGVKIFLIKKLLQFTSFHLF